MIDYVGAVLRTLGHHPTKTYSDGMGVVSYIMGVMLVTFFTLEMVNQYWLSVTNYKKLPLNMNKLDMDMREILYEGIKFSAVK